MNSTRISIIIAAVIGLLSSCSEPQNNEGGKEEVKTETASAQKKNTAPTAVTAPANNQDAFAQVLSTVTDTATQNKLKAFQQGELGKKVYIGEATSEKLIEAAKKYLGVPYKHAGHDTEGMDASGFVMRSFKDIGIELPPMLVEIARYGDLITDKTQLKPGDLLFYGNTYDTPKAITYVALYTGEGKVMHVSSKKGVYEDQFNDPYYWNDKYLFATRLLP